MTPMFKGLAPALLTGSETSQNPGGIPWGIPFQGDSEGRAPEDNPLKACEPMNLEGPLEDLENKSRRPGLLPILTLAVRGHNIAQGRGRYF
jgi:hypothetical protein